MGTENSDEEDYAGYRRLSDKKLIKALIKLFVVAVCVFIFLKIVVLS